MPNTFATLAVYAWPVLAYFIARKRDGQTAAILLMLIPYLLLPVGVGIKAYVLPDIDKNSLSSITTIAILAFILGNKGWKVDNRWSTLLLCMLLVSPIMTWLTNLDKLDFGFGAVVKQGLTPGYVVQSLFQILTSLYLPFWVGKRYLYSAESHELLVKYLLAAGLIYSIPALWEIRMSPQLHSDIYGFFPHDFRQQIREGGYRPVIFLGHGLYVAVFMCIAYISSLVIWKSKPQEDSGFLTKYRKYIPIYLLAVLFMCKTWSALIYCIVASGCFLLFGKSWIQRCALLIALIVFLYPMVRSIDLIPTKSIVDTIAEYNYDRASSLRVRFDNEDQLLAKGNERPLFGWGGSGRSRAKDPITGEDISVTDGTWIIIYGVFGWLGYLATFGLLTAPIVLLSSQMRVNPQPITIYSVGLSLILSLNMLDLIPNSSISPITFLLAGSIFGRYLSLLNLGK